MAAIVGASLTIASCADKGDTLYTKGLDASAQGKVEHAIQHLEQAANLGHVPAMQHLASLYLTPRNQPRNVDRAEYWFLQCGERGDRVCSEMLGLLYYAGYGRPPDVSKSVMWLNRAKDAGSVEAVRWLEDIRNGRPLAVPGRT